MNVLALVESPDHVCCRYRLRAFEPFLRADGGTLSYETLDRVTQGRGGRQALRRSDVIVLQRRLLPRWKLHGLCRTSAPLVFDFDDAVFLRDSYAGKSHHSGRRLRRFRAVVSRSDHVVAGNRFLALHAARFTMPQQVSVVPTCIDPMRYRRAEHVRRNAGVELVWIGSSSTVQSFARAAELLEEVGRRVPGLRLRVICDRFPRLENIEVVRCAWSQASEADDLAAADIGISWSPDDLWSRGKCGLKVLQYMAAGLPVVANPVGVQAAMVQSGHTGFQAADANQWAGAIAALAGDPELRRRLGSNGRQFVEEHYSVKRWGPRWVQILRTAASAEMKAVG